MKGRLDYGTPDANPEQHQRARLDRVDIALVTLVLIVIITVLATAIILLANRP
jgi:hypothetical protein